MFGFTTKTAQQKTPLAIIIVQIASLWTLANAGYYLLIPALGFTLSYNKTPVVIAFYFLFCAACCAAFFWNYFRKWHSSTLQMWIYATLCIECALALWGLLYLFSFLPALKGPTLAPYTDILFASPWYFLPKSMEILVQQILMTVLVLALSFQFISFPKILAGYVMFFGGAHLIYLLVGAPAEFIGMMTFGALVSTLFLPYLILKVRGGFVYSYMLHLLFYVLLAMVLHTWPPPGFYG